jgi:hypothetical protein
MYSKYTLLFCCLMVLVTAPSCKKYLEKKPNSNVPVPSSQFELQGLLDNQEVFGYGHSLGLLSADEFALTPLFYYGSLSASEQRTCTWNKEIFDSTEIPFDWAKAYEQIYYANIALEGVDPLVSNLGDDKDLNKTRGDALFKRSLSHFLMAQLFAPAYDDATADRELGIPLKLSTDAEEVITRPSLRKCYNQILSDLNDAEGLLPNMPDPSHGNRASNAAVVALKARIYLYMGNWHEAAIAAEAALKAYDSLLDFNALDTTAKNPLKGDSREIIYAVKAPDISGTNALVVGLASSAEGANVDTALIHSYIPEDLRLPVYFRQRADKSWALKFTLTGTFTPFEGISVSEVYLTLAEAEARQGNTISALAWLNKLLPNRYLNGLVPPLPAGTDMEAVLERIMVERRKELCFRGLRWMDIKRLNKQNQKITQARIIDGTVYTIPPNDLRYALPLPMPTTKKYGLAPNAR